MPGHGVPSHKHALLKALATIGAPASASASDMIALERKADELYRAASRPNASSEDREAYQAFYERASRALAAEKAAKPPVAGRAANGPGEGARAGEGSGADDGKGTDVAPSSPAATTLQSAWRGRGGRLAAARQKKQQKQQQQQQQHVDHLGECPSPVEVMNTAHVALVVFGSLNGYFNESALALSRTVRGKLHVACRGAGWAVIAAVGSRQTIGTLVSIYLFMRDVAFRQPPGATASKAGDNGTEREGEKMGSAVVLHKSAALNASAAVPPLEFEFDMAKGGELEALFAMRTVRQSLCLTTFSNMAAARGSTNDTDETRYLGMVALSSYYMNNCSSFTAMGAADAKVAWIQMCCRVCVLVGAHVALVAPRAGSVPP